MVSTAKPRVTTRLEGRSNSLPSAEGEVERFSEPYRESVRVLCRSSPAVADLALTFPGLLFALASGYGAQGARDRCLTSVRSGGSLRQAAEILELPLWLRRLPAEAFGAPLSHLPDGDDFNRRILNHVPTEAWKAAGWLGRVQMARELVDEDFALWMAWRSKAMPRLRDACRLVPLCAWAWFSKHPETFGASLLRQPFEPSAGLRKAVDEADNWKRRLELAVSLGEGIRDTWYGPGSARGYDFVPLARLEDFLEEGVRMDNCLDQFAPQVQQRNTRVFSVRKQGRSVADLEIGPHAEDPTMPTIEQLRGPANRRAAVGVWQAVYAWLGSQPVRPLPASRPHTGASRAVARRAWQPFMESLAGGRGERILRDYLHSGDVFDPEI